jgi:sec-independent protein translocase protein TatA
MSSNLFAFMLNPGQTVIVLVLGVLLFGKRLPEVGRSLGKYIMEFKRGLVGLEDDIWSSSSVTRSSQPTHFAEPIPAVAPPMIEGERSGA